MSDTPPPPMFSKPSIAKTPLPPAADRHPSVAKLMEKGGRTFTTGRRWVARLGREQAVGISEEKAAEALLKFLPE